MSNFSKHISLEALTDLAEQRELVEQESIYAHLSSCTNCASTLSRLRQVFQLMRTDTVEDAPRDVLHRAISVFQGRERSSSLLKRVVAVLSFDSLTLAPAFGTRSAQTETRQLIYSADENDIDLHISTTDNQWVIAGQVLGEGCKEGEVVIEGKGVSLSSVLSDSCEFELPAIPAGDYQLRVRLSGKEVEVPRLELRK